jgi:xanthine dehydrogenase accessory factor
LDKPLVVIRGAGDIASGVILRLMKSGFHVIALELEKPSLIRRTVSFAEAVVSGKGEMELEGIRSVVAKSVQDAFLILERGDLPILIDPEASSLDEIGERSDGMYKAFADVTIAKRNMGTTIHMAPVVVGVGPGFTAGVDAHAVVESMRGHYLGRVIYSGQAIPNTGVPGEVGGESHKRLLKAPADGIVRNMVEIGDRVETGHVVQKVIDGCGEEHLVVAQISGVVRGLILDGFEAKSGLKIGDIDPRAAREHCYSISDKALAIGGGVLQAILELGGGVSAMGRR